MDLIQATILSFVEGVTEFLPISSTGHLILTSRLLNIPQTDFVKSFEVCIQFGAILAVVLIYYKKLLGNLDLSKKVFIAFLPTAILGLIFHKFIKQLFSPEIVLVTLFLGGIFIILFEKFYKAQNQKNLDKLTLRNAFLIGLAQSVSMIPGVSRAGATIFGGMGAGLSREAATEFSFMLAIPTMAAATALDLIKSDFSFSVGEYILLLVGVIGSFFFALFSVRFLLKYIQKNSFYAFGIYRIVLALAFWMLVK